MIAQPASCTCDGDGNRLDTQVRRLLIHAGYPKAASTTLQNKLFLELHRQGKIHFLGRAFESDFVGAAPSRRAYKEWFNGMIENKAVPSEVQRAKIFGNLSNKNINVFSEGMFITTECHEHSYVMPNILKSFFKEISGEIKILLCIRSQSSHVMSYFIQKYAKIDEYNFDDYLNNNIIRKWSGESKIFNIYQLATSYANAFGKENINIIFFEDLKNDIDSYCGKLSEILSVDVVSIKNLLHHQHMNKTQKYGDYHIVEKYPSYSARAIIRSVARKIGIRNDHFLATRIEPITEEQKNIIFSEFKESNKKLADEFNLDTDKMRTYRYI